MLGRFLRAATVGFVMTFVMSAYRYSTDQPSELDLQTINQMSYIDAAISGATFAAVFGFLIPGSVLIYQFLFKEKSTVFFLLFGGEIGAMLGQGVFSIWCGIPIIFTLVIVASEIMFLLINYRFALHLYREFKPSK